MSDNFTIKDKFDRLRLLMDERMCRLWAANEALALGYGGETVVSVATGISRARIQTGKNELQQLSAAGPSPEKSYTRSSSRPVAEPDRIRRPGGGRKLIEVKQPDILPALERLLTDEVAGDPMSEQRWVRSSLRRLSERLKKEGYHACPEVVARLLRNMGFSLKANKRKQGRPGSCPERDAQFQYIAAMRQQFVAAGLPAISVDTKKKELIGAFRNNGRTWRREAEEVNEHDFPGSAECRAVPFGIFDMAKNLGYVYVGVSNDTPEFAVHSMERWWKEFGKKLYPKNRDLLILADGGGCNGCRARAWKLNLQNVLCDRLKLTVTVCHYPTGCSKWNPVEHRLFSYISKNWAGTPLKSLSIMLAYIRGTTTTKGLRVEAALDEGVYKRGQKVNREDLDRLLLTAHDTCPDWNYTLKPRKPAR